MKKMHSPRVIVLGIDGLEYDLVERWRLKNIMQKTYCKVDLSDFSVIITPPIWGSMLTGEIDDEIIKVWEKTAEISGLKTDLKQKWWAKLGKKILPFPVQMRIWKIFFERRTVGGNPFDITVNYVKEKGLTNIFQFFEKPWTNGIPSYGRNVSNPVKRKLMEKAISGDKKPYIDYAIKEYKDDKSQLFSALNKQEYELIFWYIVMIDSVGHLYGDSLTAMKFYLEINEVVGKIRERYTSSCIYVISDHGMDPTKSGCGDHSDHGFFSSNTGERIDKPYQLYNLVLKHKSD